MEERMSSALREEMQSLAEGDYRKFSSRLIPNICPDTMLGVRLPALRKIAMRLAKDDWKAYLDTAEDDFFEEIMLQGMVIGYAEMDFTERLSRIRDFLPKIDNWSVCDSFCAGLKTARKYPEEMWNFVRECLKAREPYVIRFGIVMLIDHYMDESRVKEALEMLDAVRHEDYYVKMAQAWAVSAYYVNFPEQVMPYLLQNHLDDFTGNKALQKIMESRKVGAEEKEKIRKIRSLKKILD